MKAASKGPALVVRPKRLEEETAALLQECTDRHISAVHLLGVTLTDCVVDALVEFLLDHPRKVALFSRCFIASSAHSQRLAYALSTAVQDIFLEESPQILNCLLEEQELQIRGLYIQRRSGLTGEQSLKLGSTILRSKNLTILNLGGTRVEYPVHLAPGIAASRHLETLNLSGTCQGSPKSSLRRQGLADLVVPRTADIGYGAVGKLLTDPTSHLKRLNLSNLHLEDEHVIVLVDLLRIKMKFRKQRPLEELCLSFNDIGNRGLLCFANSLSDMASLRKVSLNRNPWNGGECEEALLNGMQLNYSIEYMDSLLGVTQAPFLRYYAILNRGGRRLLGQDVPLALWPYIMARAGRIAYWTESAKTETLARVNCIFYFLQNVPFG